MEGRFTFTLGIYLMQALEGMSTSATVRAGDGGHWDLEKIRKLEFMRVLVF